MEQNIFVYGTLLKGTENLMAVYLKSKSRLIGPGRWEGEMYKVDFFPGVIYAQGSRKWVRGEVYSMPNPAPVLTVLDGYEQCDPQAPERSLFVRAVLPVQVGGDWLDCWVYLYNQPVTGLPRIDSGDFLRFELDQL